VAIRPRARARARARARTRTRALAYGRFNNMYGLASINRIAEGLIEYQVGALAIFRDHGLLNASINSSLAIPACLKINNKVELLISLWFGKVRGVRLPSGLILLMEM
jgi:hypothetical protein